MRKTGITLSLMLLTAIISLGGCSSHSEGRTVQYLQDQGFINITVKLLDGNYICSDDKYGSTVAWSAEGNRGGIICFDRKNTRIRPLVS